MTRWLLLLVVVLSVGTMVCSAYARPDPYGPAAAAMALSIFLPIVNAVFWGFMGCNTVCVDASERRNDPGFKFRKSVLIAGAVMSLIIAFISVAMSAQVIPSVIGMSLVLVLAALDIVCACTFGHVSSGSKSASVRPVAEAALTSIASHVVTPPPQRPIEHEPPNDGPHAAHVADAVHSNLASEAIESDGPINPADSHAADQAP